MGMHLRKCCKAVARTHCNYCQLVQSHPVGQDLWQRLVAYLRDMEEDLSWANHWISGFKLPTAMEPRRPLAAED